MLFHGDKDHIVKTGLLKLRKLMSMDFNQHISLLWKDSQFRSHEQCSQSSKSSELRSIKENAHACGGKQVQIPTGEDTHHDDHNEKKITQISVCQKNNAKLGQIYIKSGHFMSKQIAKQCSNKRK